MHACQGRYFLSRSRELRIRTAAFFLCRSQTEVTLCFCFLTRLAGTKKASKNEKLEPSSNWPRRRMDIGFRVPLTKYSAKDAQNSNR